MEAFFFGPAASQLFGVYHPPQMTGDRYHGIVLCYPFGQEYMRSHRAFRQLAILLSKKGFHVLRFDYRGTGDSDGDMAGVTAADWLQDIASAIQELRDMTGARQLSLVGLRLGGLLAGLAGASRRDLSQLVVWDPITTGKEYLQQIRQSCVYASARKKASNFMASDGSLHFNGFCMPPEFQDSLGTLNLVETLPACRRTLQVSSHETQPFTELANAWRQVEGFRYRHVPAEHDWNYVDHVGGILLPQPVLQEIVEWV